MTTEFICYVYFRIFSAKSQFLKGGARGAHPLKFSSTPEKNSKTKCALHVSIIIDLIKRKFLSHNLVCKTTKS